ncbi:MAG TPA: NAD(P)-binding domain-containing protein [Thermoanaerobaculia bacterium]|jgi:predicted dinucleotide-binding enzyme|nr:NAD(P)-binding domain-containing protein [Thermoanaerobaculia bacterium]
MSDLKTAVIGLRNMGIYIVRDLAAGGERLILSDRDNQSGYAEEEAQRLGPIASAAPVAQAIADADVVLVDLVFDHVEQLIAETGHALAGKVFIDTSSPIKSMGRGQFGRYVPEGTSAGEVIASKLPSGAHYVKSFNAFGPLPMRDGPNRKPDRVALFYATEDDQAAKVVEQLISAAGFDPCKAGGVKACLRIEQHGDLFQNADIKQLWNLAQAKAAVDKTGA